MVKMVHFILYECYHNSWITVINLHSCKLPGPAAAAGLRTADWSSPILEDPPTIKTLAL